MRALVVVSALAAVPAHAQPDDLVGDRLVLDAGEVDARVTWEVNLQKGRYARPLSIAPDLWVGLTRRWTVGVTHSNASLDRIDADATFCVREFESVCDRAYRGSYLDVRWAWREGALAIAPRARLLLRDVDPVKPAATVGAQVRISRGRFRIASDPYVRFGLANTDLGNRTAVVVPLWLGVQPAWGWLVELHTGWDGDVAVFPDGWHVPFSLVARVRPARVLEISLEAGFASLIGPQNNIKQRAAMLSVGYRSR